MYGYAGNILHVAPTGGSIEVEEASAGLCRTFSGGRSFGPHCVFGKIPAGAAPSGSGDTFALQTGYRISGRDTQMGNAIGATLDGVGMSWCADELGT